MTNRSYAAKTIPKKQSGLFSLIQKIVEKYPNFRYVAMGLIISDIISILLAYLLAYRIRSLLPTSPNPLVFNNYMIFSVITMPIWIILYATQGLYERRINISVLDQLKPGIHSNTLAVMIIISISFMAKSTYFRPSVAILVWIISMATIFTGRIFIRSIQGIARSRGIFEKRTLIVGAGVVGSAIAKKLINTPRMGLKVVGFVDKQPINNPERDKLKLRIFRNEDELEVLIRKKRIDHVIIAFSQATYGRTLKIMKVCQELSVEFSLVPRLFEMLSSNVRFDEIEGILLMDIRKRNLIGFNLFIKRILDIMLSSLILIVLAPILLAITLLIKIDSSGPIFFRQQRMGKKGELFNILKFRSMKIDAEKELKNLTHLNEASGPLFKIKEDPRVTKIGRFLRKFSLDEIPQFINVLKADMSIVGPRPPLPKEVKLYKDWHMERLDIVPGITGVWQTLGRSELPFDEMVKLDLNYIQNWSMSLDIKLILKTIPVVFKGRGAY